MTNPADEKICSLRTSFTKDEIIAKMLGWLRGPLSNKYTEITSAPLTEEQLINTTQLEFSLEEHLSQLIIVAYRNYPENKIDASYEIARMNAEDEIERIDILSKRALGYAGAFDHELVLGVGGILEKDEPLSQKSEEDYYTIASAENWSKNKCGVSIINYVDPKEDLEDRTVVPRVDENEGLSKTVANNFYITFALLIEAFLEADPNFSQRIESLTKLGENWQSESSAESGKQAKLSVKSLGEYLSIRSKIPGSRKAGPGQSDEAIMTHIENALKYKAKVWDMRRAKLNLR